MSNPSFSNIDRWLFELVEGNLTPEQEAQLRAFLLMHPELEVDLDAWEEAFVHDDQPEFGDTQKLQKRRPVGLYMSFGFSFMVGLLVVGLNAQFAEIEGEYGKSQLSVALKQIQANENTPFKVSMEQGLVSEKQEEQPQMNILDNSEIVNFGEERINNDQNNLSLFEETNSSFSELVNVQNTFSSGIASARDNLMDQGSLPSESANTSSSKLKTQTAKPLTISCVSESGKERFSSSVNSERKFAKSTYHRSFSTRIHYLGRALERMLDNPIALRNQNDPYYHVPGMQATDINFGAVGALLTTRVQNITRAQWLGMDNQQFINQLSIDGYSYAMRGGVGFQLNQNYYADGSIQNYHAALTYSPKFSISREVVLEPSIRFKMGSKQLNANQVSAGETVEFDRMNDQQFSTTASLPHGRTLWYRDLGMGLMVNTRWFFAGIQQDNLFRHYDNIYSQDIADPRKAPKHFVACIGSDYKSMRQKITISPYLVYQKEGNLSEAWAGFNFRFYWLTLGGAMSSNLDPAVSAGIKLKKFMLQYNMDLTRSSMLNKQLLSHQLTLRFTTKAGRVGQRLLN